MNWIFLILGLINFGLTIYMVSIGAVINVIVFAILTAMAFLLSYKLD